MFNYNNRLKIAWFIAIICSFIMISNYDKITNEQAIQMMLIGIVFLINGLSNHT
jgi:type IV secretory pathway TrbL component